MMIQAIKIRGTHHYSYRSGEWAILSGMVIITPTYGPPREAYVAKYQDGDIDYIAVEDRDNYETAPND